MKRLTAAVGALLVGAASLFAGGAAGAMTPRAQLRDFACQSALDPGNRSVSVTAVMRPVPGTKHMSVRFDLLSAQPGAAPTAIHSGDLGRWIKPPNPTLGQLAGDVWNVQKQVVPLARNRILDQSQQLSRRCDQRELRPDLLVQSITVTPLPNQPHNDLYTAVIANQGNSAAGPFAVLFAPGDGSATTTDTIALLRAHSTQSLAFVGPLCATATAPTITADSALQIHDLNRANNALTATCPAPPGG
jgi:hypothetical protein